jgi:hypothetical protein
MKFSHLAVVLLLVTAGCNNGSSGGASASSEADSSVTKKKKVLLTTAEGTFGTWKSRCVVDTSLPPTAAPEYTQSTIVIQSGGKFSSQTDHFTDENCADAGKIVNVDKQGGSAKYGSASKAVAGALEFDLTITQFIVQPRTPEKAKALEALNGAPKDACKTLKFQANQETDLMTCLEPPPTFQLIKVTGSKLQLGSCFAKPCTKKEDRSSTLDVLIYDKVKT